MLYDMRSRLLLTEAGTVLKRLECPLRRGLLDLDLKEGVAESSGPYCDSCAEEILDLSKLSERDAATILQKEPERCVLIRPGKKGVTLLSGARDSKAREILPVIKTARGREAINEGAKEGFWPLVRRVEPSEKIKNKREVYQNRKTGEVWFNGDYRGGPPGRDRDDWELVIPMFWYYPYAFQDPVAAYLIPDGLEPGQAVIIEDVIEDLPGTAWNQGDCGRLETTIAVWDGSDIQFHSDDEYSVPTVLG